MQTMGERGTRTDHHDRRVPLNNPARIFQPLVRALGWEGADRDYGLNTPGLLAKYDRTTRSWRMSEPSLFGGLTGFSGPYPKSGMMRNGRIFGPTTWRRPTKGNGCGLWHTPGAADGGDGSMSGKQARFLMDNGMMRISGAKAQINLRDQVKYHSLFENCKTNKKIPDTERELFPTPCAQDYKHRGPSSRQRGLSDVVRLRSGSSGDGKTAVKKEYFLTPRAADTGKQETFLKRMGDRTGACFQSLPAQVGGQLNADWVEALMGYPPAWTDSEKNSSFENRYPGAWLSGEWERGIPRVIAGQKNRPRRIKVLGNSILPQIPYMIFLASEFDGWR